MGGNVSIVNNTEDVWSVKLGPDESAIDTSETVLKIVAKLAEAVPTAGEAPPFAASLAAKGVVEVSGVSTTSLAAGAAAVAGISSGFAGDPVITSADYIENEVTKELGLDRLSPGEKKTYGKMTLSLGQQGTCFRTRVNPHNDKEIVVERVYMKPIFSGPTDGSENVYDIQSWINKFGVEVATTIHLK